MEVTGHQAKIAAIMVTQPGRERMARLAYEDFNAQTWQHKILIVIVQEEALRVHWLGTEGVVCASEDSSLPLGALRNRGIALAEGIGADFLIQWDDDDRYAADRMALQVTPLLCPGAPPASFLSRQLIRMPDGDHVRTEPRGIPGTVLHRTPIRVRYPEERRREDVVFRERLRRDFIVMENPPDLYVRQWHGSNTWGLSHFRKMLEEEESRTMR